MRRDEEMARQLYNEWNEENPVQSFRRDSIPSRTLEDGPIRDPEYYQSLVADQLDTERSNLI